MIYFLIRTIILESSNLAEVSLLLVIYLLLPHCSGHPSRHGDRPRTAKALRIGHAIFLFILLALWLSMFALRIRYQVEFVIGDPWTWRSLRRTTDRISTTYTIIYFLGTLEILAWSIMGTMRFLKERTDRGKVSNPCPNTSYVSAKCHQDPALHARPYRIPTLFSLSLRHGRCHQ